MFRTYLCHFCTIGLSITTLAVFLLETKYTWVFFTEPNKFILAVEIIVCLGILGLACERVYRLLKAGVENDR